MSHSSHTEYGRETVTFLEIDQPLCSRIWGDGLGSPNVAGGCQATLTSIAVRKCFNTRYTCQDPERYDAGVLTLRFGRSQESLLQYGYVLPAILSISTSPAKINLAGLDRNTAALGEREVVNITLQDFLHSGLKVDKYRLERKTGDAQFSGIGYDPYERGTFWGKWLASNPYHANYACRIREGFVGQALDEMRVRHYIIDRIEGPSDGQVKIVIKDKFSKIEARKAVAPRPSTGILTASLSAGAGSFSVEPAGIGNAEYLAAGYVVINDEVIQFTRSGDSFTVVDRGALGTADVQHDDESTVQQVLEYSSESPQDIIYDLLTEYAGISASDIPTAQWAERSSSISTLYSARIAKPTPVADLVGELCEQVGLSVYPEVSSGEIKLATLRPTGQSLEVDDNTTIVEGTLSVKRQDTKRVSQVWVYYGQINPTKDLTDEQNYRSRYVDVDLSAESEELYGAPAIKKIFSRWIPATGRSVAEALAERVLTLFLNPPIELTFRLDNSQAESIDLAYFLVAETADVQEVDGSALPTTAAVVSIEYGENEMEIVAQQISYSEDQGNDRTIYIDNDLFDVNLRALHDALYAAPTAGSPGINVTFVLASDAKIFGTSLTTAACVLGSWPAGVDVNFQIDGQIIGRGGTPGNGGNAGIDGYDIDGFPIYSATNGTNGTQGGPAFDASGHTVNVTNNGSILGGGGGGAGGGAYVGGGGGGGAAGGSGGGAGANSPVSGGSPGVGYGVPGVDGGVPRSGPGLAGSASGLGSTSGAAAGGSVGYPNPPRAVSGAGGAGGNPGFNGANGSAGGGDAPAGAVSSGGVGGSVGVAVIGNANINWLVLGTRLGAIT